jgi:hypothetical protein
MPIDTNTFNLQPTFPIAGVADLIAKRHYLEQQMRAQQQQQLVEGLQGFGTGVQSLVNRRIAMAQALAQAQVFGQTDAGKQMLAPTTTTDTQQMPVMRGQTAQGTDAQGNPLPAPIPNAGITGVGATRPQTTTTSTPSSIDTNTLARAFMGAPPESPANMLTQMFERQKQAQEFGLQQRKQAFEEKFKPQQLAQTGALTQALIGVKGREVSAQESSNIRNQITALEGKKAQTIKDFPELTGTFLSGVLPKGSNAKQEAAFNDYQETQRQIDNYNRQLYSGSGAGSSSPLQHMSTADLLAIVNQANGQ